MNIPFSGTYSAETLMRFDRAARKAAGSFNYSSAGCFGLAAIILLILGIVQWTKGNQSGAVQWLLLFLVAVVLAPMQWWSARRAFARHPNVNKMISGELRDDGLHIRTATSDSSIAWEGFTRSFSNENYLILIVNGTTMYGLSAEFFQTPQEFAAARAFATERVPGKAGRE